MTVVLPANAPLQPYRKSVNTPLLVIRAGCRVIATKKYPPIDITHNVQISDGKSNAPARCHALHARSGSTRDAVLRFHTVLMIAHVHAHIEGEESDGHGGIQTSPTPLAGGRAHPCMR
jgi:hypothetical protein